MFLLLLVFQSPSSVYHLVFLINVWDMLVRACVVLWEKIKALYCSANLACDLSTIGKIKKKLITSLTDSPAVPHPSPGQCIYMVIKGPLEHVTYNRDNYAFVCVDEAMRITIVKVATNKGKTVAMIAPALDSFSTFPLASIRMCQGTTLHSDSEAVMQSNAMKEMTLACRKNFFSSQDP